MTGQGPCPEGGQVGGEVSLQAGRLVAREGGVVRDGTVVRRQPLLRHPRRLPPLPGPVQLQPPPRQLLGDSTYANGLAAIKVRLSMRAQIVSHMYALQQAAGKAVHRILRFRRSWCGRLP